VGGVSEKKIRGERNRIIYSSIFFTCSHAPAWEQIRDREVGLVLPKNKSKEHYPITKKGTGDYSLFWLNWLERVLLLSEDGIFESAGVIAVSLVRSS
jgi:hypothetical protein